jgi:hypothetical protein
VHTAGVTSGNVHDAKVMDRWSLAAFDAFIPGTSLAV